MADLEEGEVIDSDDDVSVENQTETKNFLERSSFTKDSSVLRSNSSENQSIHSYRIFKTTSSSDSETEDCEEENFLWKRKRQKLSSNQDMVVETSAHIEKPLKHQKKDIWGSVILEQSISQGFGQIGIKHNIHQFQDRNVESYDFTTSFNDDRPYVENHCPLNDEENLFSEAPDIEEQLENYSVLRKRKRNIKERLGNKDSEKKSECEDGISEKDSIHKIVSFITNTLSEPKVDLITRVVKILGGKKTLELHHHTMEIEESEGMMTKDGSRRRTPGGVFFQLMKVDSDITKEQINEIFANERKHLEIERKKMRGRRREKMKQKIKREQEEEILNNKCKSNFVKTQNPDMHFEPNRLDEIMDITKSESSDVKIVPDESEIEMDGGKEENIMKSVINFHEDMTEFDL